MLAYECGRGREQKLQFALRLPVSVTEVHMHAGEKNRRHSLPSSAGCLITECSGTALMYQSLLRSVQLASVSCQIREDGEQ